MLIPTKVTLSKTQQGFQLDSQTSIVYPECKSTSSCDCPIEQLESFFGSIFFLLPMRVAGVMDMVAEVIPSLQLLVTSL